MTNLAAVIGIALSVDGNVFGVETGDDDLEWFGVPYSVPEDKVKVGKTMFAVTGTDDKHYIIAVSYGQNWLYVYNDKVEPLGLITAIDMSSVIDALKKHQTEKQADSELTKWLYKHATHYNLTLGTEAHLA